MPDNKAISAELLPSKGSAILPETLMLCGGCSIVASNLKSPEAANLKGDDNPALKL
ncbi:MAG TPA: hypothetical protein V6D22_12465 [Candidatus Obscuribacterales bacterium]